MGMEVLRNEFFWVFVKVKERINRGKIRNISEGC